MEISYLAIAVCAVVSMALGFVWYGIIFDTIWTRIIGANKQNLEDRQAMQKKAGPLYVIQFALTLLQVYILAYFISFTTSLSSLEIVVLMYLGFVVPTVAAASMWNNDSRVIAWSRFGIQAGYYLVLFVLFGFILHLI